MKITIDPEGYVVLTFNNPAQRSNFLHKCIGALTGEVFGKLRYNYSRSTARITIKLSDFKAPFDLPGEGK